MDIIENELFEKSVMQLSRGIQLTQQQRHAVQCLLVNPSTDEVEAPAAAQDDTESDGNRSESYSEVLKRKLKRQKRETGAEQARKNLYVNLDTLPGTSVNCERLFSQAKLILTDTRKRTSPDLFEALLLLKVNATYWNQFSVAEAMGTMDRSSVHNSNASDDDDNSVALKELHVTEIVL